MAKVINVKGEPEIYITKKVNHHYSFPIVAINELTFTGLPKGTRGLLLVEPYCKIKFSIQAKVEESTYGLFIVKYDVLDKEKELIPAIVNITDINNLISNSIRVKE